MHMTLGGCCSLDVGCPPDLPQMQDCPKAKGLDPSSGVDRQGGNCRQVGQGWSRWVTGVCPGRATLPVAPTPLSVCFLTLA